MFCPPSIKTCVNRRDVADASKLRPILTIIAWAAVILTGCAQYTARPLHPAVFPARFQKRSLAAPAAVAFVSRQRVRLPRAFPKIWNLPALVAAGWYYSPALRRVEAQLAVARAGIITAGEFPNPAFGFSPAYAFKSPLGTNPWVLGFNFDIPIQTAGRREDRLAAARALSQAVLYRLGQTAWQIRSRIRGAWARDLFSMHRLALLRRQEQKARLNERILMARFRAGRIARPILTAAQLLLQQAVLAAARQKGQVKVRRAELAAALAMPVRALHAVRLVWPQWASPPAPRSMPVSRLQRWALLNRMDVRSLLAAYAAAQANLKLQIARQYPNVHLGPGYEFDQGQNKFIFGFSVALPIFNQNQGPIAQAQARRTLLAREFQSLQTGIFNQTQLAWTRYLAAWRQIRKARRLVYLQKRQVAAAAAALHAGGESRLALVEAQQELVLLQLSRLDSLENAQLALGSLEDALQRPLVHSLAGPSVPTVMRRLAAEKTR